MKLMKIKIKPKPKIKIKIITPVTLQNILPRRLSRKKQEKSPLKRKKKEAKKKAGIVLKLKKKQGKVYNLLTNEFIEKIRLVPAV